MITLTEYLKFYITVQFSNAIYVGYGWNITESAYLNGRGEKLCTR